MWCRGLPLLGLILMLTMPSRRKLGDCMRANEDGAIAEGRLIERDDAIILKLPEAMCLEGPEDSDHVPASAEIHVYSHGRRNAGNAAQADRQGRASGRQLHGCDDAAPQGAHRHAGGGSRRDLIREPRRKKKPSSRGKLEGQHRPEGRGRQRPGGNRELRALHMEYVRRSEKVTLRRPPRSDSSGCR